ncbi:phage tail tube protein [Amycolatopsis kentuckyensis]|uniref:phage tail tube protein n=1 Tax=Amycolatopsis kentuckyensis TaxID=218823 RepID=UPI000A3BC174|nr:phage tail tube protein [Amycolatopsis kentuckyensis]
MATGSGLDGQIGFAQESTWGTPVTVTRFIEFNSENLKRDPTFLEPTALRAGTKYKRASRIRVSRQTISGDINFDINTLGMGLLVKHMLASTVTTPTLISGSAYKQVHTPGDFRGLGLTCQVGRPEPSTGTVRPFTFAGIKVSKWEFNLKDNDTPSLKLSVDGRSEATATALATASYLAGATTFDFSQATLKLGGTATTASGETTIAGGTTVATIIKEISVGGSAPMATDRFGLGNGGLKAEQLENGVPTITGKLSAEFNKTELYDLFTNNTTTALQLDLTGAAIGSANYLFSIIIPAVKLKQASPAVSGADLVQMSTDFEAYSDEVNPVIQIKIVSTESANI